MRALRAVAAILGAATGLDGNELAGLNAIRFVELPVYGLRAENQFRQGRAVNCGYFLAAPVVTDVVGLPGGGAGRKR